MTFKLILKSYFLSSFVWWGIFLGLTKILSDIEFIQILRTNLWQEQWAFYIFPVVFFIGFVQSWRIISNAGKKLLIGWKEKLEFIMFGFAIVFLLATEVILHQVAILVLIGDDLGLLPDHAFIKTLLLGASIIGYFGVPGLLIYFLHREEITRWIKRDDD